MASSNRAVVPVISRTVTRRAPDGGNHTLIEIKPALRTYVSESQSFVLRHEAKIWPSSAVTSLLLFVVSVTASFLLQLSTRPKCLDANVTHFVFGLSVIGYVHIAGYAVILFDLTARWTSPRVTAPVATASAATGRAVAGSTKPVNTTQVLSVFCGITHTLYIGWSMVGCAWTFMSADSCNNSYSDPPTNLKKEAVPALLSGALFFCTLFLMTSVTVGVWLYYQYRYVKPWRIYIPALPAPSTAAAQPAADSAKPIVPPAVALADSSKVQSVAPDYQFAVEAPAVPVQSLPPAAAEQWGSRDQLIQPDQEIELEPDEDLSSEPMPNQPSGDDDHVVAPVIAAKRSIDWEQERQRLKCKTRALHLRYDCNYYVTNNVFLSLRAASAMPCEVCSEAIATLKCDECAHNMCERCNNAVHTTKLMKQHVRHPTWAPAVPGTVLCTLLSCMTAAVAHSCLPMCR